MGSMPVSRECAYARDRCCWPAPWCSWHWRGSTDQAAAQGAVKSVHNDWQVRCDTPPGAQGEQCALIQSVTAEDRANVGLTVIVLKTADQKSG